MTNAASGRLKSSLAMASTVLTLCAILLLGSAGQAQAGTSPYCNNQTLGGYQICTGASRTLYQVYGWGDQHSVCVGVNEMVKITCSGGPEQGTYNNFGNSYRRTPKISNNAYGSNTVHGVAFQP